MKRSPAALGREEADVPPATGSVPPGNSSISRACRWSRAETWPGGRYSQLVRGVAIIGAGVWSRTFLQLAGGLPQRGRVPRDESLELPDDATSCVLRYDSPHSPLSGQTWVERTNRRGWEDKGVSSALVRTRTMRRRALAVSAACFRRVDAIEILTQDHRKVQGLVLAVLTSSTSPPWRKRRTQGTDNVGHR